MSVIQSFVSDRKLQRTFLFHRDGNDRGQSIIAEYNFNIDARRLNMEFVTIQAIMQLIASSKQYVLTLVSIETDDAKHVDSGRTFAR